jgi:hypothetical protein
MSTSEPQIPLKLGEFVCRRSDSQRLLVGIVVGFLFVPVETALVRWANLDITLEPLDILMDVLKFFG